MNSAEPPVFDDPSASRDQRTLDLANWRSRVAPILDVEADETNFSAQMTTCPMGEILLIEVSSTAQRLLNGTHEPRESAERMLVGMIRHGSCEVHAAGRSYHLEPGDITCLDQSLPFTIEASAFAAYCVLVPRRMLFAMPADTALHGRVLPAHLARARVLAAHFQVLAAACPSADPSDQDVFGMLTAALLEAAFVDRGSQSALPGAVDHSRFAEMCRFVEENLSDPTLSADRLCDTFGASRATLYRMFERSGGVASFIRDRRLTLAHRALSGEQPNGERISVLAARVGFRSEDTFSRAFREKFGLSPRQLRTRAGLDL